MSRLPGTPGPLRWMRYAIGFRLPAENRDWVRHDLTDAGWRVRAGVRQVVVAVPIAAVCAAVAWAVVGAATAGGAGFLRHTVGRPRLRRQHQGGSIAPAQTCRCPMTPISAAPPTSESRLSRDRPRDHAQIW